MDDRLAVARECLLSLFADADRFDEDCDGDMDSDGHRTFSCRYHITTGHRQLSELCEALGIKVAFDELPKAGTYALDVPGGDEYLGSDRPASNHSLDETASQAVALKALDDLLDHVRHINERARNGLASHGHTVAERYVEGSGGILLRFDIRRAGADVDYVAVLHDSRLDMARDLAAKLLARYARVAVGRDDQLVFVDDVQVVKCAEEIITSRVWLQRVDGLPKPGVQGGAQFLHGVFLAGSIFPEREASFPASVAGQGGEIAHENVDRAAEVVYGVAGDRGDLFRDRLPDADAHSALLSLRVNLTDQGVRVSPGVGGQGILKLVDVAFCPFHF